MDEKQKFKKINKKDLPIFYRLILKIPLLSLGSSSGLFWAIFVPIFIALNFFLDLFILVYFSFPINLVLAFVTPVLLFILFMRVMLERMINWWNSFVVGDYTQRELSKIIDEYVSLIKNKRKAKT